MLYYNRSSWKEVLRMRIHSSTQNAFYRENDYRNGLEMFNINLILPNTYFRIGFGDLADVSSNIVL